MVTLITCFLLLFKLTDVLDGPYFGSILFVVSVCTFEEEKAVTIFFCLCFSTSSYPSPPLHPLYCLTQLGFCICQLVSATGRLFLRFSDWTRLLPVSWGQISILTTLHGPVRSLTGLYSQVQLLASICDHLQLSNFTGYRS